MHYEEQAENEKPDWFTYELFGGGKEVRVVARRAKERKKTPKKAVAPEEAEKKVEEKKEKEDYLDYPKYKQEFTG